MFVAVFLPVPQSCIFAAFLEYAEPTYIFYRIINSKSAVIYKILLLIIVVSKDVAAKAGGKDAAKRDQTRTNKESGDRMTSGGHIGGAFSVTTNPAFLETRSAYFETLWAIQQASTAALQSSSELAISVTLPDGSVKQGVAFKTSPYDIAKAISTGLADSIIIAKVCYTSRLDGDSKLVQVDDEADEGIRNKQCNSVTDDIGRQ